MKDLMMMHEKMLKT